MCRIKLMLSSVLALLLLSSCGNTGPLYLPNDKASKKEKTASVKPVVNTASKQSKQEDSFS